MKEWLFQFYDTQGSEGWWLNLNKDNLEDYIKEKTYIDSDKEHFKKLDNAGFDDSTKVTHTQYEFYVKKIMKNANTDIDTAYDILKLLQATSMRKIIADNECLLVNRCCGFRIKRKEENPVAFVRRNKLEFPRYYNEDIRIKRFPDGHHYYAYIGDMQVRDGDILKWNTYEEALKHAEKFLASTKSRKK